MNTIIRFCPSVFVMVYIEEMPVHLLEFSAHFVYNTMYEKKSIK